MVKCECVFSVTQDQAESCCCSRRTSVCHYCCRKSRQQRMDGSAGRTQQPVQGGRKTAEKTGRITKTHLNDGTKVARVTEV